MSWQCIWQVVCEQCKATGPVFWNSSVARTLARQEGWTCGKAGPFECHLCAACAASNRPVEICGQKIKWEGE